MPRDWMTPDEAIDRLLLLHASAMEGAADGDPRWRAGLVPGLFGMAKPIDQDDVIAQALDAVALEHAVAALEALAQILALTQAIVESPALMATEDVDRIVRIRNLCGGGRAA